LNLFCTLRFARSQGREDR